MAESFIPPLYELTPLSFAVQKTSFLPETGTLLSASQTFPLIGELPFRGDITPSDFAKAKPPPSGREASKLTL